MIETEQHKQAFELLDHTLETYGADTGRWPQSAQTRLQPLIIGNSEAQRRVAAARALDRVLGLAPRLSEARHAELVERIVAGTSRQPRVATAGVSPLRQRANWFGGHTLAAAALAASLVLGIAAGQNATVGTLTDAIVTSADVPLTSGQQVAQGDDADSLYDEDFL